MFNIGQQSAIMSKTTSERMFNLILRVANHLSKFLKKSSGVHIVLLQRCERRNTGQKPEVGKEVIILAPRKRRNRPQARLEE